jgi:hypothetical protein
MAIYLLNGRRRILQADCYCGSIGGDFIKCSILQIKAEKQYIDILTS